jgi:hypothetical protein
MNLSWLRNTLASQPELVTDIITSFLTDNPELVTSLSVEDASITNAKLAALARGSIKVGGADDAVTDLVAKTSGQILVGDDTDLKSVAVSGDATLSAEGAITIATNAITSTKILAGAVTAVKIADGVITDAKIADGANISASKIALANGTIAIGDATNVVVGQTISGDITISNAGVAAIASNSIVNADVNTAAAIAFSKLAALADGKILVGSALTVPTEVAVYGDATLANDGAITISEGAVEDSMLEALADGQFFIGVDGTAAHNTKVVMIGDAAMANTGEITIAAGAITIAKCADAVQDLIATASVAGVDNTNGTGTFTVQVKDAAGNALAQYSLVRAWRSATAYGAAAAATGFVSATGTTTNTVTANADLEVITASDGSCTFTVTDNGAHHVNVEVNGRIYTGTVTVTTA